MKKVIIILLAVLLLLAGGAYAGYRYWYESTHVEIEATDLPCDIAELTLTGAELPDRESLLRLTNLQKLDVRSVPLTLEQYDQLCQDFPNCQILWLVPFQGQYLPPDLSELEVSALSASDLNVLPYFPALRKIDAAGCRDYDVITLLMQQFPELEVSYSIRINGQEYAPDITHLAVADADIAELSAMLPYLTDLEEFTFTGIAPDNEQIYQLMCEYPNIRFLWDLTVFGVETSNTATSLIFSGTPMTADQLEAAIRYFPDLERVEVCDCGIPSEEMDVLTKKYPDIRFIWTIKVGNGTLRTDVTAFIPYKFGYHQYRPLYDEDCTELKYCIDRICLDMGHMKIKDFSFLENMPNLKYLIVADTPCQDFSVIGKLTELIYLEIFVTNFTQHEVLLNLTKLEDLNLGSTPTSDITALKQMTWLKRLWIPNTGLNYLQVAELKEALPSTRIMVYADHSTDKGWRQAKNYYDMRDLLGMFYME